MTTERTEAPLAADELTMLRGFLQYHRKTLLMKTDGLTGEQLNQRLAPSTMTLGGLMKHLALVENWWFEEVMQGAAPIEPWASVDWDADRDWEWNSAAQDTPEQLRALLGDTYERVDAALDRVTDLDALALRKNSKGTDISIRWILIHLIEEYARHNGHADLLRESIDGETGE